MTEAHHDQAGTPRVPVSTQLQIPQPPNRDHVNSLRGASAGSIGRTFWLGAAALGLVVIAAVIVVSLISAFNDHARVDRMKAHGIPVAVIVTACDGNLGGSGSNGAGYTCRGAYRIDGTTFHEVIGSMATFAASGTTVRAVADPSNHGTIALSSAVKTSKASPWAFVPPGAIAVVLIILTFLFVRVVRRRPSN
jgi:hypothetical protein